MSVESDEKEVEEFQTMSRTTTVIRELQAVVDSLSPMATVVQITVEEEVAIDSLSRTTTFIKEQVVIDHLSRMMTAIQGAQTAVQASETQKSSSSQSQSFISYS